MAYGTHRARRGSSRGRRLGDPASGRRPGRPEGPAGEARLTRERPDGRLHRLLGILALLLVIGLGATLFLTSSAFGVSEILVSGSDHLTSADVVRACGVELGTNLLKVPTRAIRDRLAALPRVAEATVSRRLPGTLVVRIVEREGAALLQCGQQYAELDVSGFPVEFHRLIGALGLPIVTGLDPVGVTLGVGLQLPGLDATLATAAALGVAGRARVSEIHLDANREVVLYTRSGLPVYVGPAMGLETKVPVLLGILDDIEANGLEVSYIDVRYPRYPVVGSAGGSSEPAEWEWADPDLPVIGEP